MTHENPVDVYVVGTGMVGYRQFTKEAEAAVRNSERVFLVHFQNIVESYLEDEVAAELDVAGEVELLTSEYDEGEDRGHAYERMAERVLEGARERDAPVTFALYGHPMVFVSPTRFVLSRASEEGLVTEVRPGISSVDCLYCDLELDPARNGIQMFEATDLLLREFRLTPDVPAFIWQIGTLETGLHTEAGSAPGRFTRLREYLQEFYPEDHTVYLCQTATYPVTESEQIEFDLNEFEEIHDRVNGVQTLYVPPTRQRPTQNEALAEKALSADHLDVITETTE
ncbi:MAG: SAM-dependent methyltransferase [Halobacteriales archaeon]